MQMRSTFDGTKNHVFCDIWLANTADNMCLTAVAMSRFLEMQKVRHVATHLGRGAASVAFLDSGPRSRPSLLNLWEGSSSEPPLHY